MLNHIDKLESNNEFSMANNCRRTSSNPKLKFCIEMQILRQFFVVIKEIKGGLAIAQFSTVLDAAAAVTAAGLP